MNTNGDLSKRERRVADRVKAYQIAAAPLLAELSAAGYEVRSVADLRNSGKRYRSAIPALLYWLPRVDYDALKDDIVRSLTVPWAKPEAALPIIEAFESQREITPYDSSVKWAMGNALSVVADDSVYEDIVRLVRDKRHGRAREMLAFAIGNMKNPEAVDVLIELLDDEEVAGHALRPLGKLKAAKARRCIERFLDHPKAWIRREAKGALAKIDRAAEKAKEKAAKKPPQRRKRPK